jgi:magnesium chelatase family protein
MLAHRLPALLPPMSDGEALETAAIASLNGGFDAANWRGRPFRAPHHTASGVALVGGGGVPRPGEISLAHHGVLFLDELPEWDRHVVEVLREPLESGSILVSRAARQTRFPAAFQLVAAMNPCPCGFSGHASGRCNCSEEQVRRYRGRVSGALYDRIDMAVDVPALSAEEMTNAPAAALADASVMVRERVAVAHRRQVDRQGKPNAKLSAGEIERLARATRGAERLIADGMTRLALSARGYHRVLKVARTIADLADSVVVDIPHAAEAVGYRRAIDAGH